MTREAVAGREATLWRYAEMLPGAESPITLGEGWTPLHRAKRLGRELGLESLWVKDESVQPTGSFKARGMTTAVTMAARLGAPSLALPSAGNAGGAAAAYGALAGGGYWRGYSLWEGAPPAASPREVFSEAAAFLVADMLEGGNRLMDVCGHAADIHAPPVAWKTGTSSWKPVARRWSTSRR